MNGTAPAQRTELALLGLLALLWGSSYLFIKVAVVEIPPITLIACRVVGAAVFLLGVLWIRGEILPRDVGTWRALGVQAFFNSFGAWTVLAWGQQYVDSGLASVLNSTSPIFVGLFVLISDGAATLGLRKALGLALGMGGVVLVVGPGVLDGLGDAVLGQAACLLGAILYAGAALYGKRLGHISPTAAAAGTMIWASAVLVPAAFIVDDPVALRPGAAAVGSVCVLAFVCTGAALLVYFRLLRTIGPVGVASQSFLRAGVGVLLGILLLGESLTPTVALGLSAAVAGVALVNTRGRDRRRSAAVRRRSSG